MLYLTQIYSTIQNNVASINTFDILTLYKITIIIKNKLNKPNICHSFFLTHKINNNKRIYNNINNIFLYFIIYY